MEGSSLEVCIFLEGNFLKVCILKFSSFEICIMEGNFIKICILKFSSLKVCSTLEGSSLEVCFLEGSSLEVCFLEGSSSEVCFLEGSSSEVCINLKFLARKVPVIRKTIPNKIIFFRFHLFSQFLFEQIHIFFRRWIMKNAKFIRTFPRFLLTPLLNSFTFF